MHSATQLERRLQLTISPSSPRSTRVERQRQRQSASSHLQRTPRRPVVQATRNSTLSSGSCRGHLDLCVADNLKVGTRTTNAGTYTSCTALRRSTRSQQKEHETHLWEPRTRHEASCVDPDWHQTGVDAMTTVPLTRVAAQMPLALLSYTLTCQRTCIAFRLLASSTGPAACKLATTAIHSWERRKGLFAKGVCTPNM